jgi:hypothetical protein
MSRPIATVFTLAAAVSAGGQRFAPNAKDLLDRLKYLFESYGRDKVKEVWRKGAGEIPRITGQRLDAIEAEWHQVIRSRAQPASRK